VRCGTIENGCGQTLDCEAETGGCGIGGHCEGLACICDETDEESNEVAKEAWKLDDDSPLPLVHEASNLHNQNDVDWFKFEFDESATEETPLRRFQVALSMIPAPSNYQVNVGIVCQTKLTGPDCVVAGEATPTPCSNPAEGNQNESVHVDYSCTGKVTVYIQVVSVTWAQTCAPYKLQLNKGTVASLQ